MVLEHIRKEIHALEHPLPKTKSPQTAGLKWTDASAALIELAYALQSSGSINHGNVDVKTIITILEELFQTDTGNYYSVYNQNIRIRKKNRTIYLNKIRVALENRMNESDENPRFK